VKVSGNAVSGVFRGVLFFRGAGGFFS
jgi:hypothetical protein